MPQPFLFDHPVDEPVQATTEPRPSSRPADRPDRPPPTTPAPSADVVLVHCQTQSSPGQTSPSFAERNHDLCFVCLKALDPDRARRELNLLVERLSKRRSTP